jgi:hypothetical protein
VIGIGDHRADTVEPSWQATGDVGKDLVVGVGGGIDAEEEGEDLGVERGGGVERAAEVLDGDVGVSNDEAVVIEEGGGTVVRGLGVCEVAEVHADGVDDDLEGRVFSEILVVAGEGDQRRGHVGLGGDETLESVSMETLPSGVGGGEMYQWDTVARAGGDLKTVGKSLTRADIDKVVVGTTVRYGEMAGK